MKQLILGILLASACIAHAGWYYWDHGHLMWANKWGVIENVEQIEQEERDQELQDKLDEINDKLQAIQDAQEEQD